MTKDKYNAYLASDSWNRTRKHKLEQAGGIVILLERTRREAA